MIPKGIRRSCSIFLQKMVRAVVRFMPIWEQMSSTFFFSCASSRKFTFTLLPACAMTDTSFMENISHFWSTVKRYHYDTLRYASVVRRPYHLRPHPAMGAKRPPHSTTTVVNGGLPRVPMSFTPARYSCSTVSTTSTVISSPGVIRGMPGG